MKIHSLGHWIEQHWLSFLGLFFLVIPTAGFVIGSAVLAAYIYWPLALSKISLPTINPDARHIFLLAHGLRDTTKSWTGPLQHILERQSQHEASQVQVIALDWRPYSDDTLGCSVNGKRIGEFLGAQMALSSRLESVHLIGHSCGSFVVLGLCDALKEARNTLQIQTTYLDPVSIYGGFFWNYGIDHFGRCGDFSEAYINNNDGVPGSDELLPKTHTFDITAVREKMAYSKSPHVWPTYYYQHLVRSGNYPALRTDSTIVQRFPRGVLEYVSEDNKQ